MESGCPAALPNCLLGVASGLCTAHAALVCSGSFAGLSLPAPKDLISLGQEWNWWHGWHLVSVTSEILSTVMGRHLAPGMLRTCQPRVSVLPLRFLGNKDAACFPANQRYQNAVTCILGHTLHLPHGGWLGSLLGDPAGTFSLILIASLLL